jgi:integrase/recombinase XerD
MLTYLTQRGLSDAQIQLISGHQSKRSLEDYQHLSLDAVEDAYQEAVLDIAL